MTGPPDPDAPKVAPRRRRAKDEFVDFERAVLPTMGKSPLVQICTNGESDGSIDSPIGETSSRPAVGPGRQADLFKGGRG